VKVPDFDYKLCPFVLSRDNTGLNLIDVKNLKAYKFSDSPITVNLFGHGDALRIGRTAFGLTKVITIV
jgi:hypothetical protein